MKIISFAWTSEAFKAGRKTVTRRQWSSEYAKQFKAGDICKAYDRQPRFGGKQIGLIKIKSISFEPISSMPVEDYENEGFKYMEEKGLRIWKKEPADAFNEWMDDRTNDGYYWVVRFEKIEGEIKNEGSS